MTILALLITLGVLLFIQNSVYRRRAMQDLYYRCFLSKHEAFEGETLELVEEIENRKSLILPWLKSELTTSESLDFAGSQAIVANETRFVPSFFMIRGYQKVVRRWHVTAREFGIQPIVKAVIVASDLLGFVTESAPVAINSKLTVLPRPIDLDSLAVDEKTDFGELVVRRRLLTDPFFKAGVRPYQPADDLKNVHWYATAREGELMVFEHEATLQQSLTLIINMQSRTKMFSKGENPEALRQSIRIAATAIDQTLKTGLPVKLMANAAALPEAEEDETEAGRPRPLHTDTALQGGREHVMQLLRTMARLPLYPAQPANEYFEYLLKQNLRTTDIILVTHYIDDYVTRFAERINAQGTVLKIALLGPPPADLHLPDRTRLIPLYRHLHRHYRLKEASDVRN